MKDLKNHKYLWLLISIYTLITITSDLYESKIIHVWLLRSGSGILLFSCTFFIIGIITYIYGLKTARTTIYIGLLFCCTFVIISYIGKELYYAGGNKDHLNIIVNATQKIFISTIFTSLVSEHINAFIVSKLKFWLHGKYIGITLLISIFISSGVSMTIFCVLAFSWRVHSLSSLLIITVSSWLYRFITEICLIPLSTRLIEKIQKSEQLKIT